ncbi:MAG: O-antigen ligase family protein [Caldilineaceae bacterium]|nr:O-antigen ligase family protein [Caldilineaceae bacterium]
MMPRAWTSVQPGHLIAAPVVALVLLLASLLGARASLPDLALLAMGFGAILLVINPSLRLPAVLLSALLVPFSISTGTEVMLHPVVVVLAAVTGLWLLRGVRAQRFAFAASPANLPLLLFLIAGLLSFAIGNATWDWTVPHKSNFWLVQFAQWSIFALSAAAFWLTANTVRSMAALQRLTWLFLGVAGALALLRMAPASAPLANAISTGAFIRAPLWVLLTALGGGQLLFNRSLGAGTRLFLVAVLVAVLIYAFVDEREAASTWLGIGVALAVLGWLRWSQLRWLMIGMVLLLAVSGVLFPFFYEFAGGDQEWDQSGGARLVLIERVIEVTMRNPITGLGPAAYRPYANIKPLPYGRALWMQPQINSHNNYVDIFSHGGLVGLALFGWFALALWRQGLRVRQRHRQGFASGYVNGALAAGAASLVIMLLADWILPFVYNIGFYGFQASVLVWLFLGGVVVLDRLPAPGSGVSDQ